MAITEKPLWQSDRFILFDDHALLLFSAGDPIDLYFAQLQGVAIEKRGGISLDGLGGAPVVALRVAGVWYELPPFPPHFVSVLEASAKKDGIFEEGWPTDLPRQEDAEVLNLIRHQPRQLIREYADAGHFEDEAALLSAHGYEVATTTQQEQRPGALSILSLGLLALLTKPKAHLIVTYRRLTPAP